MTGNGSQTSDAQRSRLQRMTKVSKTYTNPQPTRPPPPHPVGLGIHSALGRLTERDLRMEKPEQIAIKTARPALVLRAHVHRPSRDSAVSKMPFILLEALEDRECLGRFPGVVTCTGAGALADAPPSPSAPKTEGSLTPAARSGEMWAGTAASSSAVDTVCSAGSLRARAGVTLVDPGPKLGAGPSSMRMGDTLMAGTSTGASTAVADVAVGTSPPMTSRSGGRSGGAAMSRAGDTGGSSSTADLIGTSGGLLLSGFPVKDSALLA